MLSAELALIHRDPRDEQNRAGDYRAADEANHDAHVPHVQGKFACYVLSPRRDARYTFCRLTDDSCLSCPDPNPWIKTSHALETESRSLRRFASDGHSRDSGSTRPRRGAREILRPKLIHLASW